MEWQLERVRRALKNYRIANSIKASPLPWVEVAAAIEDCEVNRAYYEADEERSFRSESLRRFAERFSELTPEKMDHLIRFLCHEGLLQEEELRAESEELSEMLTVSSYLADSAATSAERLSSIRGCFEITRQDGAAQERVALSFTPELSGAAWHIIERHTQTMTDYESATQKVLLVKDKGKSRDGLRRGYGFLSTQSRIIHIFLRGAGSQDRVSYIELDDQQEKTLTLLRRGSGKAITATAAAKGKEHGFMRDMMCFTLQSHSDD